jgi:PAS domain S-box-containing protein
MTENETGKRATGLKQDILDILDALPFYVLLIDENHNIIEANKAVSEQLGVERENIIGQYCPKIIHGLQQSRGTGIV